MTPIEWPRGAAPVRVLAAAALAAHPVQAGSGGSNATSISSVINIERAQEERHADDGCRPWPLSLEGRRR